MDQLDGAPDHAREMIGENEIGSTT
jgi:hypothetical protein